MHILQMWASLHIGFTLAGNQKYKARRSGAPCTF
jgi:hypothetical protein